MRGSRKFAIALVYLALCFVFSTIAVCKGYPGTGIAAVCLSWASGVGLYVRGNIRAAQVVAANGGT